MTPDRLAEALSRWADGLAAATRNQLSTYDLRALFDGIAGALDDHDPCAVESAVEHWVRQLGPATRDRLSSYDVAALVSRVRPLQAPDTEVVRRPTSRRIGPDPTGLGPPAHPEHARARGYTGDPCNVCGSMAVVRSGTCATCQDCGAQSGCS